MRLIFLGACVVVGCCVVAGCGGGGSGAGSAPVQWEAQPPTRVEAASTGGTTASGLEFAVLRAGTGQRPTASSRVRVHYHGTLPDGTVFDSSVDRGQPATFGLGQVIPGWKEGLQLMREGAKYRFRIPPHLAYGGQGMPPKIGPNQTLVFEVELLEVL